MCLLIPVFVTCSAIFYKIIEIIIPMKFFNGFFFEEKTVDGASDSVRKLAMLGNVSVLLDKMFVFMAVLVQK